MVSPFWFSYVYIRVGLRTPSRFTRVVMVERSRLGDMPEWPSRQEPQEKDLRHLVALQGISRVF